MKSTISKQKEEVKVLREVTSEETRKLEAQTASLETKINESCTKWIEERKKVDGELEVIDSEIAELKRKMEEKNAQREAKDDERKQIISEIDKVKENFKDEEDNVETLKAHIEESVAADKKLVETIEKGENELEETIKQNQDKLSKRHVIFSKIKELTDTSSKKQEQRKQHVKDKEAIREKCWEEYHEWHKLKRKVRDLQDKHTRYEEKASKNESQISDINIQTNNVKSMLAKMEEDKKTFAVARKFKDAAKVATDIKVIQSNIEKLNKSLEEFRKEKENWDKEIAENIKEVEKFKDEEKKAEEKLNKSKYRQIALKIEELEDLLGVAEEIKSGDEAVSVIKNQIEIHKEEANHMRVQYAYLDECDYERWPEERMNIKLQELKAESSTLEGEIDELSKKEEYETAESKQAKLNEIVEKIKAIEGYMSKRFPKKEVVTVQVSSEVGAVTCENSAKVSEPVNIHQESVAVVTTIEKDSTSSISTESK